MNLYQLKQDCPKMPDDIREMIAEEVYAQTHMPPKTAGRKANWKKTAVITLAAAMALGTTAFAGVRLLYQWKLEKEGTYGLKGSYAWDNDSTASNAAPPEMLPVLSIEAGWLPEGMEAQPYEDAKFHYADGRKGGITVSWIEMDESGAPDSLALIAHSVTTSETLSILDKEALYLETAADSYNKRIYIAFPEYWQVMEIYTDSLTREEAVRFAENLSITATAKMRPLTVDWTWSDIMEPETEYSREEKLTASAEEMKNLHQPGESFPIPAPALVNGENTYADSLEVCIKDVKITDDLSTLDAAYLDLDILSAVGDDGKLVDNTICYYSRGDGIHTLDEELQTETVGQKLVTVTAAYTNTGDTELQQIMINGYFIGLTEENGGYTFYDRTAASGIPEADFCSRSSIGRFGEMDYYSTSGGYGNGTNYIPSILPGETVEIQIAKVVNEDELDKMYLSIDGRGAPFTFSEYSLEAGYVDIRQ